MAVEMPAFEAQDNAKRIFSTQSIPYKNYVSFGQVGGDEKQNQAVS